jgi:hypothetical protein
MNMPDLSAPDRPRLYYRASCAKCRTISLLLQWMSMSVVCRLPLSRLEARELFAANRLKEGRPVFVHRGRFVTGPRILPCIAAATSSVVLESMMAALRKVSGCLQSSRHPS